MSSVQNKEPHFNDLVKDCFIPKKNEKLDNVISKLKGRIGIVDCKNTLEDNSGEAQIEVLSEKPMSDRMLSVPINNSERMSFLPQSVDEHSIFTKSFLMWENISNICWLDASMSLLAHNRTLQRVLADSPKTQIGVIIKQYNEAMCILNDYTSPDNSDSRLFQAKLILKSIQDSTQKYLEPMLKCVDGQPDSAFCSLFNLISKDKIFKPFFNIEYVWVRNCEKCLTHWTKKDKKVIITLSRVNAFQPDSPSIVCQCPSCKEPNQNLLLMYRSLPQCLLFHFENGAGKGEFQALDFEVENRRYKVTGIMTLEKGTESDVNHFVTWIRDPDTEGWLECNDLNLDIISFSVISPCINLEDIYILMYEVWGDFSDVPLVVKSSKVEFEEEESASVDIPLIDITEEVEESQVETQKQKGGCNEIINSQIVLTPTEAMEKSSLEMNVKISSTNNLKSQCESEELLPPKEAKSIDKINNGNIDFSSKKVTKEDIYVDAFASLLVHTKPLEESQFSKLPAKSSFFKIKLSPTKSSEENRQLKLTSGLIKSFIKNSADVILNDSLISNKDIRNDSLQVKPCKSFVKNSATQKKVQSKTAVKSEKAFDESVNVPENSASLENPIKVEIVDPIKENAPTFDSRNCKKKRSGKVPLFIENVGGTKNKTLSESSNEDLSNKIGENLEGSRKYIKSKAIAVKAFVSENEILSESKKSSCQNSGNDAPTENSAKEKFSDCSKAGLKKPQVDHPSSMSALTDNLKLEDSPIISQTNHNFSNAQTSGMLDNTIQSSDKLMELKKITKFGEKVLSLVKDKSSEGVNSDSVLTNSHLSSESSPYLAELQRKKMFSEHTKMPQSRGIIVKQVSARKAQANDILDSPQVTPKSAISTLNVSSNNKVNTAIMSVESPFPNLKSPKRLIGTAGEANAVLPKRTKLLSEALSIKECENTVDKTFYLSGAQMSAENSIRSAFVSLQRLEKCEISQLQVNCIKNKDVQNTKDKTDCKEDQKKDMLKSENKTEDIMSCSVVSLKEKNKVKNKKALIQTLSSEGAVILTEMKSKMERPINSPCKVSRRISQTLVTPSLENTVETKSEPKSNLDKSLEVLSQGEEPKSDPVSKSMPSKRGRKTKNANLNSYMESVSQDTNPSQTLSGQYKALRSHSNAHVVKVADINSIVTEQKDVQKTKVSKERCLSDEETYTESTYKISKAHSSEISQITHQVAIQEKQAMVKHTKKRKVAYIEKVNYKVDVNKDTSKFKRSKSSRVPSKSIDLDDSHEHIATKKQEQSLDVAFDRNETGKRSRRPSKKLIEAKLHSSAFVTNKSNSCEISPSSQSKLFHTDIPPKTYSRKSGSAAKTLTVLDAPKVVAEKVLEQDNLKLVGTTQPKYQQGSTVDLSFHLNSVVLPEAQTSKINIVNQDSDHLKTQTNNIQPFAKKCSEKCECHLEDVYNQIDVVVDSVVNSIFDFFGISKKM